MSKTVLVAEDHEDNLVIVSTILMHQGYAVLQARDGKEALALARTKTPDLLLLDVSLPYLDGWVICSELKADPATAGIVVVILTAHALQEDRDHAREVGSDAYLSKPIEPKRVADTVRAFIGPA